MLPVKSCGIASAILQSPFWLANALSILPAIFVIPPELHHEVTFLRVVFRSMHTQGPSLLVLDSDEVGTSTVAKCLKADFSGHQPAENGGCSVSNQQFGTRLLMTTARKIVQNSPNWIMPATLPLVAAHVAQGRLEC
jgi:hypothetical protein